jgi:hypothetical protein
MTNAAQRGAAQVRRGAGSALAGCNRLRTDLRTAVVRGHGPAGEAAEDTDDEKSR